MTGIDPLITAATGAVVKIAIDRAVPGIFGTLRTLLLGKTIMVVGPARSGKSTFINYLQYGIFQHEQETGKTYHPISGPKFRLRIGAHNNLEVQIKAAIDLPGQYPDLSEHVFNTRPHALVVILDVSAPLDEPNDQRSTAPRGSSSSFSGWTSAGAVSGPAVTG